MELEKVYNPLSVESKIYERWLEKNYFHAKADKNKRPFTIVIPPPNITGKLHMGHALDNTLQDILIRWKRMDGFSALWMPGCDHASISTEMKIVEHMAQEGLTKQDIGREEFLKRAWKWKEQYGGSIMNQLKKLGSSLDFERERFTMDEGLSKAVIEVFVRLYEKKLIYRGERMINWCPHCKTSISDAEVNHEEREDRFYHIKYKIKDTDSYLEIATTRPETMFGDTALAVNPEDPRYQSFVGLTAILPVANREIPIIADSYVDKDFGTGVVKITPAHDPNDFEVGERHNLKKINVINDDGTMNENAGAFAGLDRRDARKKVVQLLENDGLLIKTEPIRHAVGVHERCNVVVEPLVKLQWFVKMEDLAKPAIDAYQKGELNIIPERFGKIYLNWLLNIRDWCISRQLWWGHRIPAYYCLDCSHMEVARHMPDTCSHCGSRRLRQDEDTLDTWFSSALWPFSTLGWPEQTEDLNYFYPTDVLVTAYDIIFFWVIRMVFSGIEHTGKLPFKDVLIHGLIRDSEGRKFSKTLGNGIDPLDVIDQYGADALRLMLVLGNSPGNDMRFYFEKVEASRNFTNKLWNASRFVLMNLDGGEDKRVDMENLTPSDKWILSKVNSLAKEVSGHLGHYELGISAQKIYDFLWDEYCDWYIEMVKPRLYQKDDETRNAALFTLKTVLVNALKLLHPFMPFITEEIFTHLQSAEETIMLSVWPKFLEEWNFSKEEKEIEMMKEAVRSIRNIRSEMNVPPSKKVNMYIVSEDEGVQKIFEEGKVFFKTLSYASDLFLLNKKEEAPEKSVSAVLAGATIYLPFDELVDIEAESQRLAKEQEKLRMEVDRASKKLSNEGFLKKAPQNVIEEEKEKLEKYEAMLEKITERILNLR